MGATKVITLDLNNIEKTISADVVLCSNVLSENFNPLNLLKKLRSITKQTLIFNIPSVKKNKKSFTSSNIESILARAGFEIREKHIYSLDTCLVCRVV